MARGYYFNMEQLSIHIAKEHTELMTDCNMYTKKEFENYINVESFIPNLKNGMVVITMLTCYIESFLNSIILSWLNYDGERLLKCNLEEKLEIVFLGEKDNLAIIKGKHEYEVYRRTSKIRNELIHFKKSWILDGTGISSFNIKSVDLATFFTKNQMEECCKSYEKLIEMIAHKKGLSIYKNVDIIACDGRDGLVNYVFDKDKIEIDDKRDDLASIL